MRRKEQQLLILWKVMKRRGVVICGTILQKFESENEIWSEVTTTLLLLSINDRWGNEKKFDGGSLNAGAFP